MIAAAFLKAEKKKTWGGRGGKGGVGGGGGWRKEILLSKNACAGG